VPSTSSLLASKTVTLDAAGSPSASERSIASGSPPSPVPPRAINAFLPPLLRATICRSLVLARRFPGGVNGVRDQRGQVSQQQLFGQWQGIRDRPSLLRTERRSLTLQRRARQPAHKGGSGAMTLRTYPPLVQHPNRVACTCDVLRRRFMGRTLLKTAHRRIPAERVRFRASPS
jgi:hypothetical protein